MQITRRLEFDAGHRIPNHLGQCRHLHGHRYVLEITLSGDVIHGADNAADGMLMDFSEIKRVANQYLLEHWDHAFFVYREDRVIAEFLASLPTAGAAAASRTEEINPRTFAEARNAGNDAREEMSSAETLVRLVKPKIAATQDPAAKADLEKQVAEAEAKALAQGELAFKYYRKALELAAGDPEVTLDDLNVVRYFLSYLHFQREEYYDAAVIAEFSESEQRALFSENANQIFRLT